MRRALEEYRIVGVRTNIPFHQTLMDSHRFMGGQYDTRFVEERFAIQEEHDPELAEIAAALATLSAHQQTSAPHSSSGAMSAIPPTGNGLGVGKGCTDEIRHKN
jgi:acetyl/propionyl-CoA carboxylase alpha subunit